MHLTRRVFLLVLLVLSLTPLSRADNGLRVNVVLEKGVFDVPFTGRVYLAVTDGSGGDPLAAMTSWTQPVKLFATDAMAVSPGEVVRFGRGVESWPVALEDLEPGFYRVQAVVRRSENVPSPGSAPGDRYSDPKTIEVGAPDQGGAIVLTVNREIPEIEKQDGKRLKRVSVRSEMLSAFWGWDFDVNATVVLPAGYEDDPDRSWPVVYYVPGFGGTGDQVSRYMQIIEGDPGAILIGLDPTNKYGHSVFADSENCGPWGAALVKEVIPGIEAMFRCDTSGEHRYVTGISSGGWSSLWLQVTYPETFAGCWSHVPDPVDFADFQSIDLYDAGSNMYRDAEGERRPLMRSRGQVILYYEDFVGREDILAPGGQIGSFEAVFGPRGDDGEPVKLFDRETGEIDSEIARSWEPYDIHKVLRENWDELAPRLDGKLRVYGGGTDNFYLEGSVARLAETMQALGADADVRVIDGMPHTFYREGDKDMYATIKRRWSER